MPTPKNRRDSADSDADLLLAAFRPIVDSLAQTLGTTAEVVLHDFRQPDRSIVAIAGSVTARHVGGAMSEIGLEILTQGPAAQDRINYHTRTADGRTIKSSTMVIRDRQGSVIGALCVNTDITRIRQAVAVLRGFVGETDTQSGVTTMFSDDITKVVEVVIRQEEERLGQAFSSRTRPGRLEVIKALDSRGVFKLQRAADEVAKRLGVSRATVYADLNTVRGMSDS